MQDYGRPEIFNSDQGAQFTSGKSIETLTKRNISISMDGRGRGLDNVFVERLWLSVKYEDVFLKGYRTIPETREGLEKYFEFYNNAKHHQGRATRCRRRFTSELWSELFHIQTARSKWRIFEEVIRKVEDFWFCIVRLPPKKQPRGRIPRKTARRWTINPAVHGRR